MERIRLIALLNRNSRKREYYTGRVNPRSRARDKRKLTNELFIYILYLYMCVLYVCVHICHHVYMCVCVCIYYIIILYINIYYT